MLATLQSVEGLEKLVTADKTNPQGQKLIDHARKELQLFRDKFAKATGQSDVVNEAMELVAVVKTIGQQMAYELKAPWLAAEISKKILVYYGQDLSKALESKRGLTKEKSGQALQLATALASADPIMLFMTGKISKQDAAKKIAEMAKDAGKKPPEIFELLSQQFQMLLGSFDAQEISKGTIGEGVEQHGDPLSGAKDLIGELSSTMFRSLVELTDQGKTQWKDGDKGGPAKLTFTQDATVKLQQLEQAVATVDAPVTGSELKTGGSELSEAQQKFLGRIEQQDKQQMQSGGRLAELRAAVATHLKTNEDGAERMITAYQASMLTMPLTITFNADHIFSQKPEEELVYSSALKQGVTPIELGELLPTRSDGEEAEGELEGLKLPKTLEGKRNNPNYMRWRYEKDTKPAGYSELGVSDLPEFGALSPSFEVAQGAETTTSGHGTNQYGSSHMVLREEVRNRAAFQMTAKGALHRDPLALLYDIAVAVPGALEQAKAKYRLALQDFQTKSEQAKESPDDQGLKAAKELALAKLEEAEDEQNRAKAKAVQSSNVLNSLMMNIASGKEAFLDQQQIEVQIFGKIDLAKDVKAFYFDPEASAAVKKNLKAFAKANGIRAEETKEKKGTKVYCSNTPGPDDKVTEAVEAYLESDGEIRDAENTFDQYAKKILGLERLPKGDKKLYDFLYSQATRAYRKLSKKARKKNGRKETMAELEQHIVIIEG